MTIISDLLII